jgi:hypothetical protein
MMSDRKSSKGGAELCHAKYLYMRTEQRWESGAAMRPVPRSPLALLDRHVRVALVQRWRGADLECDMVSGVTGEGSSFS